MIFLARILYHFKTNIIRYICFLLSFIALTTVYYFNFEDAVINISDYNIYNNTSRDEIWFANEGIGNECFYNFNGTVFVVSNERALNADILMQQKDNHYEDNLFNIDYVLNDKECALSKNTAKTYKLSIGDILIVGDNKEYKITYIFDAINGVDPKYRHEGVVVLAYNEDISESYLHTYLFFANEGGTYFSTFALVNIDNIRKTKMNNLIKAMSIILGVTVITLVLEDFLIFRHRERDYQIMCIRGCEKKHLFPIILLDNLLRVILPVFIASIIFIRYAFLFTYGYLFVVSNVLCASLLCALVSTIVYYYRRISYARIK